MQNFLSTLAQLSATLLAIFLATVTAYIVFIHDRATQFTDRIEQTKLDIRDILLGLRTKWPSNIHVHLPPGFKNTYRSQHPDKSGPEWVTQIARELVFEHGELVPTIELFQKNESLRGPWKGRVYLLILTEAVSLISYGSPHLQTKPEGVYPSSPTGPGFDEWRASFEKLREAFGILFFAREAMLADFTQYVAEVIGPAGKHFIASYVTAITALQGEVEGLKEKLNELDKLKFSEKRYSLSEHVHFFSLSLLTMSCIIFGLLVPLILLAIQKPITSVVAVVLLVIAVSSFGGTFFQFGWDVSRPRLQDPLEYASAKWYQPMVQELDRKQTDFQNGALLDVELFSDALLSEDRKRFSTQIADALREYVNNVKAYNEVTARFNEAVVEAIRADKVLGPLGANYKSNKGGMILYPANFLNEERWNQFLERVNRGMNGDISVEVLGPGWSSVRFKFPGTQFSSSRSPSLESLKLVRNSVKDKEEANQHLEAKKAVEGSVTKLKQAVRGALQDVAE